MKPTHSKSGLIIFLLSAFTFVNCLAQEVFQHVTNEANTAGHITTLDNAATNGKPDAVLIVAQNYGVYNANEIGVWYSQGKWKIFNQNKRPLPMQASFNVLVVNPAEQKNAFVHTVTNANSQGHVTTLDNAATDAHPNALVFVTQNFGQYNDTPVGVWFNNGKWKIYNENRSPLPINAKFNVVVLKEGAVPQGLQNITGNSFAHKVDNGNKIKFPSKHVSYINNGLTDNKKQSILFITQQYKSAYNTNVAGVWFDPPNWTIFNENRREIPDNVVFNVLALDGKTGGISKVNLDRNTAVVKNRGAMNAAVYKEIKDDRKKAWQEETKVKTTGLFILPYTVATETPPETGTAVNTDMQGPNLALGKDVSSLFTQTGFSNFVTKLNLFRDVYEDKNSASGYLYYLPKNYSLKWNKENGEYSFYVYYLSAGTDGRGKVIITAELTPNISRDDIALAEAMLTKQMKKEIKLRPLPLRDTPKVSFGNSLSNFDVANESITTNVPTDFLEPIIVSWRMDSRVDDLTGAMMNNIGITGNIEFLPHGEEDKVISVPVKLKVNDTQTFGNMSYTQAGTLLNGLTNAMDYPILLKQLIVMREKPTKEVSIETLALSDYEVEPKAIFSSFSESEKTTVLNGDLIKKVWVDYVIKSCDECDDSVQSKIMGGTSNSRVKNIEVTVLTPLGYSSATSLKLLIKSKQGDPKGKSDVVLPIINIARDNQTISGGDLFVAEGSQPDYQYQLVMIKPTGETLVSEWITGHELFIIVGENTIRDHFETMADSTDTKPTTETQTETEGEQ